MSKAAGPQHLASFLPSYDDCPAVAVWEMTRACSVSCKNCRAERDPLPDCAELTTARAKALLDELAQAGVPCVVFSGGDPARRPDVVELVVYGRRQGLAVVLALSATPLSTTRFVRRLADAGLARLAMRLDGHDAASHDGFRGIPGSFEKSLELLGAAQACDVPIEIDTLVHVGSIDHLDDIAALARTRGAILWRVIYSVPSYDRRHRPWSPAAVEQSLHRLAEIAQRECLAIETLGAPQYRRITSQRGRPSEPPAAPEVADGRGMLFIAYDGSVCPSRALPIVCGNAKAKSPIDIYQYSPIFRTLRDREALTGRCGGCEYKHVCGGSRARAYAKTGSLLASDPLCPFEPAVRG
jgi:radical SAM protein with 4Fe4S-binding SPASM domain